MGHFGGVMVDFNASFAILSESCHGIETAILAEQLAVQSAHLRLLRLCDSRVAFPTQVDEVPRIALHPFSLVRLGKDRKSVV